MSKNSFPDEGKLRAARILIVDDEQAHVRLLEWTLKKAEFPNVRSLTDPLQAAGEFTTFKPDLVLLDWHMPAKDGLAVLTDIQEHLAPDDFVPVLVLTGSNTAETRKHALATGAHDFLGKPLDYTEVMLRIKNLLQTRYLYRQNQSLSAELAALRSSNTQEAAFLTSTRSVQ